MLAHEKFFSGIMPEDIKKEYTRFEKSRLIGARALQIARGAPIMIKTDLKEPVKIAELEFEIGVIPLDIKRRTTSTMGSS